MRIERRLGVRSAYGQLVLIVFLPIAILAMVGGVLVFFETTRALKSEQDVLAQSALVRYEPIVLPLLSKLTADDYIALQKEISSFGNNGMTRALSPSQHLPSQNHRYMADELYQLQSEQRLLRVGIFDGQGEPLVVVGFKKNADWGKFDPTADSVWRLKTAVGTAYGMPIYADIDGKQRRFWLFVDMDNESLMLAYYRILLALAVTGLTTILLLLLILNLYSKRWIAPVYEMRLFLQKLSTDNLGKSLTAKTDGEFYLLQKELNLALRRLNNSFGELKARSDETEADLQQAFDEMEMQNISIRQARDEAIFASQTKSAFLANISHELRTPLNAIDGFINLLSRSNSLDSKQALYVQTIQKSSAHLLALISDVLDFSKIEAGKLALESYEFDLYDVVYEVADMLSPTALDKGLRMSVMIYQDVPVKYLGDRLRVKQILTNLIGNAVKFTDRGGVSITVSLDENETHQDMIKFLVSDTGKGVDKAAQNELFKSFGQGDLSITRRYGGTGLGLVISKELVSLMNGEIGFFDNAEQGVDAVGASFWFSLPVDSNHFGFIPTPKHLAGKKILAWIAHDPAMQVLKASLAMTGEQFVFDETKSLAQLLDRLSDNQDYDWVISDSFGQQGDISALLSQIRYHYQGKLLIYGFELGLDNKMLMDYGATALHEPLDRRKLYAIFDNQISVNEPKNTAFKGIRVLCVDDHKPNLLVLEALLNELSVEVVQAESGFMAIDYMERVFRGNEVIDLIFMDIQMPNMSGIATSSAIRKLQASCNTCKLIPIIALSAHGLWNDMESLYKAGINDYATKPIARQTLSDLLQKWLSDKDFDDIPSSRPSFQLQFPNQAQPVSQSTLADIDWADAQKRASGNEELAKKLFGMLMDGLDKDKAVLEQAWADNNLTTLYETVHRILGATRYTGVPKLRQACENLHGHCSLDNHDIKEEKLTELVQEVINAINDLQKTYKTSTTIGLP